MNRDESGQLTPLVIGFAVIVVLLVAVVANASNAFLHRRSLASWADGAATVEFSARVPLVWANEATSGFGGGIPVTARTTAVSPLR
jgi:hypothetical protein